MNDAWTAWAYVALFPCVFAGFGLFFVLVAFAADPDRFLDILRDWRASRKDGKR